MQPNPARIASRLTRHATSFDRRREIVRETKPVPARAPAKTKYPAPSGAEGWVTPAVLFLLGGGRGISVSKFRGAGGVGRDRTARRGGRPGEGIIGMYEVTLGWRLPSFGSRSSAGKAGGTF